LSHGCAAAADVGGEHDKDDEDDTEVPPLLDMTNDRVPGRCLRDRDEQL
jgi:hypothetical protein